MTRRLVIDDHEITDNSDCYVIAEIGHNHQGDLEKAKELFRVAKEFGADAVKLQKRSNRSLFTQDMFNQPYENENSFGKTYGEHREFLEFGRDEYTELKQYANDLGITFFATAFDFDSANFLRELDMPAYKIASGDLRNLPLIRYVANIGRPMVVSTGGGTMDDVQRVYDAVMPINDQLCIMQCTASYPCAAEHLNLRVIETFRKAFPDIIIGLSSHDNGVAMPLVGYMLGARMIEKHFTLNRTMKGTDHAFSLAPDGLRRLVRDLKRAHVAHGDGVKRTCDVEKAPMKKMGKKLVAAHPICAGHVLTAEDITIKSPGDGLAPYEIESVIGKACAKPLTEDENITFENLTD